MNIKFNVVLLICLFSLTITKTLGQAGSLDPTFNSTDNGYSGDGANSSVSTICVQVDGKVIVGGSFTSFNGVARNRITRLNSDKSIDYTFNAGSGANGSISKIAIQSDGKIIIVGEFTSYNGISRIRVARLNSDGSLDNTFNPGSGANSYIHEVVIQPDGKIIIVGNFTSFNGSTKNRIARLNNDGSLDNTFNPGAGSNNHIYSIALQTDGKIIIGGTFTSIDGIAKSRIARLNSNATIDNTFISEVTLITGSEFINAIVIQSDGKILIGGNFYVFNGVSKNNIVRLNNDGSTDNTFNPGTGTNDGIYAIAAQANGKIIIGGNFLTYNGIGRTRVARLNNNGTLDNTFNPGVDNGIVTIAVTPIGKIIIGGIFGSINELSRNRFACINDDGSNENTFNPGTGANSTIYSTKFQSDGKILIGGDFSAFNGITQKGIARITSDGVLDNTFNTGTGASSVKTIAIQSDGKIIAAGYFSTFNGVTRNGIVRINSDGSLDNTFNPGTGVNLGATINIVILQTDGKIIIGGDFYHFNGVVKNFIARLNSDGSLDNTFNSGTGLDGYVQTGIIQSDGKIIIGGQFNYYNGTVRNDLVRINNDGTLDPTFNPGTGVNYSKYIYTVSLQTDGKIIIGGDFNSYNNTVKNGMARINIDGSVDNTFNSNLGSYCIRAVSIQPDGKFIIGGNDLSNGVLAKLNTDGTYDNTFNPGTGPNYYVYTTALQSDAKIIAAGVFYSYNGVGKNRIARIINPQDQSIIFNSLASKVYGDVPFSLTATSSSGLPVSFVSSNPSVATVSGNIVTIVGAGTVTITASQPGNTNYNAATSVSQQLIVNKASLIVTADNKSKIYGATNPAFTIIYSGFVNGETAAVIDTPPTTSTTATPTSNVGSYPITPAGGLDNNYMFTYANGSLTIDKASLIATADNKSRTYGAANPAFTLSYSGFVNGETASVIDTPPTGSTSANPTSNVGSYAITPSGGLDNNYAFTYANGTLTIGKASIMATSNASRPYNTSNPVFTITYTGLLNGETGAVIDSPPSASTTATISSNVGNYTITLSGGSDNNYSLTLVNGVLTITKANQTVNFSAIPVKCGTGTVPLVASASSGLGVNFSSSNTSIATISGSNANALQTGTVTITATQAGNTNYNSASSTQSLVVASLPSKPFISQIGCVCEQYVTLQATGGSNYVWSTGYVGQTVSMVSSGSYYVTSTNASGCSRQSGILSVTIPSCASDPCGGGPVSREGSNSDGPEKSEEELLVTEITVYPNPADAMLTIHLPEAVSYNVVATLYSQFGQEVKSTIMRKGENKVEFDTKVLSKGMYIVRLLTPSGATLTNRKVMVSH